MEGKVNELFDPSETVVEVKTINDEIAWEKLKASQLGQFILSKRNDAVLLKLHREQVPVVMKEMVQMDIGILSFHSKHSLEDYFLSLTTANQHVETVTN